MFDAISYLIKVSSANKLVVDNKFLVSHCTDLHMIEPLMDNYQTRDKFVLVMDNVDGAVVGGVPGWFNRRVYTVAIMALYKNGDLEDRNKQLNICREIYRQMLTKFIIDKDDMTNSDGDLIYMRTNDISYREMGPYSLVGATGVIFTLRIDEPTDLTYDPNNWIDG